VFIIIFIIIFDFLKKIFFIGETLMFPPPLGSSYVLSTLGRQRAAFPPNPPLGVYDTFGIVFTCSICSTLSTCSTTRFFVRLCALWGASRCFYAVRLLRSWPPQLTATEKTRPSLFLFRAKPGLFYARKMLAISSPKG